MNYNPEQEHSKDVYLCLIKMYLSPPNLKELGIRMPDNTTQPDTNVKDALSVLTRHYHLIDTIKVRREGGRGGGASDLLTTPLLFRFFAGAGPAACQHRAGQDRGLPGDGGAGEDSPQAQGTAAQEPPASGTLAG